MIRNLLQSRELNELAGLVRANSDALREQSAAIAELREQIAGMGKLVGETAVDNQALSDSVKKSSLAVLRLNDELASSLTELKLLKTQLQSRVAEKIEAEFRTLLLRLEKDAESISRVSREMALVNSEAVRMRQEFERLSKISDGIKSADFELVNFSRRLQADEAEKLKLMKQVDDLQRLVSSMRRRQDR